MADSQPHKDHYLCTKVGTVFLSTFFFILNFIQVLSHLKQNITIWSSINTDKLVYEYELFIEIW